MLGEMSHATSEVSVGSPPDFGKSSRVTLPIILKVIVSFCHENGISLRSLRMHSEQRPAFDGGFPHGQVMIIGFVAGARLSGVAHGRR